MHIISLGIDCAMGGALKDHLGLDNSQENSPFHGIWIYNKENTSNIFSIGTTIAPLFETRFKNWGLKKPGTRRDLPISTIYPIEFTHKSVFWPKVRTLLSILDNNDPVIFAQMLRLYNYNGDQKQDIQTFQNNLNNFINVMEKFYPHKQYNIKFFGMVSPDVKKKIAQKQLLESFLGPYHKIKCGFPIYGRHKFKENPGHKTTSFYGTGWGVAFKEAGL